MRRSCIYDRYEECCHECPGCPEATETEADPDMLYDEYTEEGLYEKL